MKNLSGSYGVISRLWHCYLECKSVTQNTAVSCVSGTAGTSSIIMQVNCGLNEHFWRASWHSFLSECWVISTIRPGSPQRIQPGVLRASVSFLGGWWQRFSVSPETAGWVPKCETGRYLGDSSWAKATLEPPKHWVPPGCQRNYESAHIRRFFLNFHMHTLRWRIF
jgi:hypothetical protein